MKTIMGIRWAVPILTAIVITAVAIAASVPAENSALSGAPLSPEVQVDRDASVHWGPRTIPFARFVSPESRAAYMALIDSAVNGGQPSDPKEYGAWSAKHVQALFGREKATALTIYPVDEEDRKIGGADAAIYTPKKITEKNRLKVMMEFEVDSAAIAVASLAGIKVIALHYGLNPSTEPHREMISAYSELLKTYKPQNIGMFGVSGGCSLLHTALIGLPQQHMPFPGAIGLLSCAGAGDAGDTWTLDDGIDPIQSIYLFPARPPRRPVDLSAPRKPGDFPRTPLDGDIPDHYPPTYLLAGTRDMSLSETVLLHRKLKNAGVETDLNVFEGMWHGFDDDTETPESREALTDLAHFMTSHLGR